MDRKLGNWRILKNFEWHMAGQNTKARYLLKSKPARAILAVPRTQATRADETSPNHSIGDRKMTTRKASTKTKYSKSNDVLKRWRVKSDSSDRTYTVVAVEVPVELENMKTPYPGVEWRCSCRGWTMHTPRKDCKHIRHVKQFCS